VLELFSASGAWCIFFIFQYDRNLFRNQSDALGQF
jgi:hypothetical protein